MSLSPYHVDRRSIRFSKIPPKSLFAVFDRRWASCHGNSAVIGESSYHGLTNTTPLLHARVPHNSHNRVLCNSPPSPPLTALNSRSDRFRSPQSSLDPERLEPTPGASNGARRPQTGATPAQHGARTVLRHRGNLETGPCHKRRSRRGHRGRG